MEKSFVNNYLTLNGKYFPNSKLDKIGKILENSNASEYVVNRRFFSPLLFAVISFFFIGFINPFDRIILRDWFWGVLKIIFPILIVFIYAKKLYLIYGEIILLVPAVIYGLWLIIDVFTLYWRVKNANYKALLRSLNVSDDN